MKWHRVACVSDLQAGEGKTVEPVPGKPIALLNNDGVFQAIDNTCPHRGGSLSDGKIKDNCIVCPLHQWTFNLATGENIRNPKVKLHVYQIKVEGDAIWIAI